MIQRIQSIYLLGIIIISALLLLLPYLELEFPDHKEAVTFLNDSYHIPQKYGPISIAGLSIILSLITIFSYKNRKRQMRLCIVLLVFGVLLATRSLLPESPYNGAVPHYSFILYLPVLNIVFAVLARRAIKKDDDLVRSADRIR
jgi:hypothetical protein